MDTNNSDSTINNTSDPTINDIYLKYESEWRVAYIISLHASMYGTRNDKMKANLAYKNAIDNLDSLIDMEKK
jgi:hypothetical protein